jgi:transposase
MARKNYSDEFRRQAVDLYESTLGATLRGIADDLGISRGTLADLGQGIRHRVDDCPDRQPDEATGEARDGRGEDRPARGRTRHGEGGPGQDRD